MLCFSKLFVINDIFDDVFTFCLCTYHAANRSVTHVLSNVFNIKYLLGFRESKSTFIHAT